MRSKFPRYLILISLVIGSSCLLNACSLFGKSVDQADSHAEAAKIVQENPEADLKKNERGLSQREEDFLSFGEDKLANLITAFNEFGQKTSDYQAKVLNEGIKVSDNKAFTESRNKLLQACSGIEAIPLSTVPETMRNFFDQNFRLANRCRYMAYAIEKENATNLPDAYNIVLDQLNTYASQAQNFISTIKSGGIDAASQIIPAVNWDEEMHNRPPVNDSFDVSDMGLNFGCTRAQVMGIEGLIKDYDKLEKLEYDHQIYTYHGVRKYYFNEYDQLYKVSYSLRPNNHNPYNDLRALYYPIQHHFEVPNYFDSNFDLNVQNTPGTSEYFFTIDRPHLTAIVKATSDQPEIPVTVDVNAKLSEEDTEKGKEKEKE